MIEKFDLSRIVKLQKEIADLYNKYFVDFSPYGELGVCLPDDLFEKTFEKYEFYQERDGSWVKSCEWEGIRFYCYVYYTEE